MAPSQKKTFREQDDEEMKADPFIGDEEEEEEEDADLERDGPPSIDPYAILGLEDKATADDVKKAYRKMALKHHPGWYYDRCAKTIAKKFQTRRPRTRKKLRIKPSKRLLSPTPSYPMNTAANATTSQAVLLRRSRAMMNSTGSSSTASSLRMW